MKTLMTLGAIVALAIAGSASAFPTKSGWSWTPANTAFSGSGQATFDINNKVVADCTVALTGNTLAQGSLQITGVTYTDCAAEQAAPNVRLEWMNPISPGFARWGDFSVALPPSGVLCHGNIGAATVYKAGNNTVIHAQGACASVDGAGHIYLSAIVYTDTGTIHIVPTGQQ